MKWLLPSVLVAGGLTLVAGAFTFRPIADDVKSRTAGELSAAGHDWATLSIRGRDLVLSGAAPQPDARKEALSLADAVFGVRVVADETTVLPLSAPFAFSIERDGDRLTLQGAVPNDAARKALLAAAARIPGVVVSDRLSLARGAAESFGPASLFALAQAGGLAKGRVALADGAYSISGDPIDWPTYRDLEHQLADALPAGVKLAADGLVAPAPKPYRFALKIAPGGVSIEGFLPEGDGRGRLVDAVKAIRPGTIDDRATAAPGAPAAFVEAISAALPDVARLDGGGLELRDTTLTIFGTAPTAAFAEQVRGRIGARLPAGITLAATPLAVVPPAPVAVEECRAGLGAVQASGKIRFETGRSDLDVGDLRVLDTLVLAALRCGTASVVVEGHTDNVGDAEANLALSGKRAEAVVGHLVAAGVAPERLRAVGYGDTRPVGDNTSEDGRQMNRRIDFSVE